MSGQDQERDAAIRAHRIWLTVHAILFAIGFVLILFMWNWSRPIDNGDLNAIAVSLTVVEILLAALTILLGLGAFAGFWLIRNAAVFAAREEAREAAQRVAEGVAERVAKEEFSDYRSQNIPSIVRRTTQEWLEARDSGVDTSARDQQLVNALGEEENEDAQR